MRVLALLLLAACGRVGFDPLTASGSNDARSDGTGDGAGDGTQLTSPITHAGPFAVATGILGATFTQNVTAHGAGNVVAMIVGCSSATAPTGVTVTAPGWNFYTLEGGLPNGEGTYYTVEWVAITPDVNPVTMTVSWSGSTCELDEIILADEFTNVRTSGGVTGVASGGGKQGQPTGHCAMQINTVADAETIWVSCYGSTNTTAVDPPYSLGADDTGGDLSGYRITTEPAGTAESPSFTGVSGTWVMDTIELLPP